MVDHKTTKLQQFANIVINAYLNRHRRFKPNFGTHNAVVYFTRPTDGTDHPDLLLGHWYDRSDFEPEDQQ